MQRLAYFSFGTSVRLTENFLRIHLVEWLSELDGWTMKIIQMISFHRREQRLSIFFLKTTYKSKTMGCIQRIFFDGINLH